MLARCEVPSSRRAFSIGSNGSFLLARMPNSTSRWKSSGSGVSCGSLGVEGLAVGEELADRHAVLGQRAGLVHAQHRGGPERLDGRDAAGQHPLLRDAPGAQGQEDRQHDRELLRQRGHGHGDAGQEALLPAQRPCCRASARRGPPPPRRATGRRRPGCGPAGRSPSAAASAPARASAGPCRSCRSRCAGRWPAPRPRPGPG